MLDAADLLFFSIGPLGTPLAKPPFWRIPTVACLRRHRVAPSLEPLGGVAVEREKKLAPLLL